MTKKKNMKNKKTKTEQVIDGGSNSLFDNLLNAASEQVSSLVDKTQQVTSDISNMSVSDAASSISDLACSAGNKILDATQTVGEQTLNATQFIGEQAVNAGGAIVDAAPAVVDAVGSVAGAAAEVAGNVISGVADGL